MAKKVKQPGNVDKVAARAQRLREMQEKVLGREAVAAQEEEEDVVEPHPDVQKEQKK